MGEVREGRTLTYCKKCGMVIVPETAEGRSWEWTTNEAEPYIALTFEERDEIKEPWMDACAGSKENYTRWPTFSDAQRSDDDWRYQNHEPIDALSQLVMEEVDEA